MRKTKKIEPRRTGANAIRKKEQAKEKILTHVPRIKPGRFVLLAILLGVAGYHAVKFVKSGKIGAMIAPVVASGGIEIKGVVTLDSLTVINAAKDSNMTITPKAQKAALERVKNIPGVASASLGITLAKKTTFTIKERTPVALAVFNGSLYFMSSEGYIWPFKAGSYWDFPVLTGVTCKVSKKGIYRISDNDMKRYRSIMDTFKDEKEIRPVGFDFGNPDRISVRFNGIAPTIRFGNDPQNRLENMNGILEIVRRDDVEVRHYIDLSYKNVAFIR